MAKRSKADQQELPWEDALREALATGADEFEARLFLGKKVIDIVLPKAAVEVLVDSFHGDQLDERRVLRANQKEMTPNEAAHFLRISRPTLIKLMDSGEIPFRTLPSSRHRRIAVEDVLAYYMVLYRQNIEQHNKSRRELFEMLREDDRIYGEPSDVGHAPHDVSA